MKLLFIPAVIKEILQLFLISIIASGCTYLIFKLVNALESYPIIQIPVSLIGALFMACSMGGFFMVANDTVVLIDNELKTRGLNPKPLWDIVLNIVMLIAVLLIIAITVSFVKEILAADNLTEVILPIIYVSAVVYTIVIGIFKFLKEKLMPLKLKEISVGLYDCFKNKKGGDLHHRAHTFLIFSVLSGSVIFIVIKLIRYIEQY